MGQRPGPRVTPAEAARLGSQAPAGATIDRAANRITFTGASASTVVLASPAGGPDETFRIAGMVNPAIAIKARTRVSIEVINADPDAAHGLVVTAGTGSSSWMPMMTARPAFTGSTLQFLGNPTSAGMHEATLTFTASTPGQYRYTCARSRARAEGHDRHTHRHLNNDSPYVPVRLACLRRLPEGATVMTAATKKVPVARVIAGNDAQSAHPAVSSASRRLRTPEGAADVRAGRAVFRPAVPEHGSPGAAHRSPGQHRPPDRGDRPAHDHRRCRK